MYLDPGHKKVPHPCSRRITEYHGWVFVLVCGTRQSVACIIIMIHIIYYIYRVERNVAAYRTVAWKVEDVEAQLLSKFLSILSVSQNLAKPYIFFEPNWLKLPYWT